MEKPAISLMLIKDDKKTPINIPRFGEVKIISHDYQIYIETTHKQKIDT